MQRPNTPFSLTTPSAAPASLCFPAQVVAERRLRGKECPQLLKVQVFNLDDAVAERGIACQSLFIHPSQHWHRDISIVVDLYFRFILMKPVKAANVLLESSSPAALGVVMEKGVFGLRTECFLQSEKRLRN